MTYDRLGSTDYDDLVEHGLNHANNFFLAVERLNAEADSDDLDIDEVYDILELHDDAQSHYKLIRMWQKGECRSIDSPDTVERAKTDPSAIEAVDTYRQAMMGYMELSRKLEDVDMPHFEPRYLLTDMDLDNFKAQVDMLHPEFEE